ncbi:MAG TPA: tRNA preQ1(34) S-adenosylmethionine ribosyltransferase-isomerase QueA [Candidatus Sulfotelmatobacter sp.]|nr:tRNA preQ1(34) S-adenosylmethionine ribosyltransferase-isomerase QueA [Candidatus Sulfotelmatobacter sp.]
MLVSEFHYHLPPELIAQEPLADRAGSRLLRLNASDGGLEDRQFREFPDLLRTDDVLVFNDTRVFPARLYGRRGGAKAQTVSPRNPSAREFLQGRIEVLLTRQLSTESNDWVCLVRPGRKIGIGEHLYFGEHDELRAEVVGRGEFGERTIRFEQIPAHHNDAQQNFFAIVERLGHIPLPPYIGRSDSAEDRERYQTVYARERGSVAAPTAGLHFTPDILRRVRERGIETAEITLHVGLGTFQPIHCNVVEEHRLHAEAYSISPEAAEKITHARSEGRRVVAIGTTTVRTLEFVAQQNEGKIQPGTGEAKLFIYPGYKFQVVGALLTNFHLPESTLLMLVCALGGKEYVMRAYEHAVREQYRFYSYGDCMLLE